MVNTQCVPTRTRRHIVSHSSVAPSSPANRLQQVAAEAAVCPFPSTAPWAATQRQDDVPRQSSQHTLQESSLKAAQPLPRANVQ